MTRLPDFLGVGASRTATTWLHVCLEEHPDVFVPAIKEIDYFSKHYRKGLDWYATFFRGASDGNSVGEISGTYMIDQAVPRRIHSWNPHVRLIFSVRNPVERAYSHYCMHLRAGKVSRDVDREIKAGTRYVIEGFYHNHISRFLSFFPEKQIKVLVYDDLAADPKSYLQDVLSFLGVDPSFEPALMRKTYHSTKTLPASQRVYDWLVAAARYVKRNSLLGCTIVELLRRRGYVDVLHHFNRGSEGFPSLSPQRRIELARLYEEDVVGLSSWLNRDLTSWLESYVE